MDDTGARLPETDAIFSARSLQELVYLFVDVLVKNKVYKLYDFF